LKKTIIYIYPTYSTFIKKDLDFLSENYNVKTPTEAFNKPSFLAIRFLKQFLFLIKNIKSTKVVFVMFGGYWSFLPALFCKITNKSCYIILGGADCVSFPSINYGSLRKPFIKLFIKWSYQLCTKLIPVDESLVYNDYSYYENSTYNKQGYKAFFPKIETPYKVIYNGFDTSFFESNLRKKSNSFILVASIPSMSTFKLKGVDIIFDLAKTYPNCTFTIVGLSADLSSKITDKPSNITLYPFLSSNEFKKYLLETQFVLQLSISEGFPNALCEAMLCNCIPIGSNVGAIPTIIKDTGYIINSSNFNKIKSDFDEILQKSEEENVLLAEKARKRIVEEFPLSKRQEAFYQLIK